MTLDRRCRKGMNDVMRNQSSNVNSASIHLYILLQNFKWHAQYLNTNDLSFATLSTRFPLFNQALDNTQSSELCLKLHEYTRRSTSSARARSAVADVV